MHSVRSSLTLVLGTVLIPLATASPVVAQEWEGGHCPGKLEALNRLIRPATARNRAPLDRRPRRRCGQFERFRGRRCLSAIVQLGD